MLIKHFEISNFRKLHSIRIDVADKTTIFVGANNSGKTSAMHALRQFLVKSDKFTLNDFTLSNWPAIKAIGEKWRNASSSSDPDLLKAHEWSRIVPSLDVWLHVENDEIHHVSGVIPTLDWEGGLLGVRLRFEPKDLEALYKDFVAAVTDVAALTSVLQTPGDETTPPLNLWPKDLTEFLERKLGTHFTIRTYVLDPSKLIHPNAGNGQAQPQILADETNSIDGNALSDLIRIDEIDAQRGFGQGTNESAKGEETQPLNTRKLSEQLQNYYNKHLNPFDKPDAADLGALKAIEAAQAEFDKRLAECFLPALSEVEGMNYPGVTDPRLTISTLLRPVDGLDHAAAVRYEVDAISTESNSTALRLPESSNGLGYQNLISMIFRLMSFRDAWMRVGKAGKEPSTANLPAKPLHLVLIEEPEAHLHAQVQQVFIRKAYENSRKHDDLRANPRPHAPLLSSPHSSHLPPAAGFSCLRYFRRLPAGMACQVPVSAVVNLEEVFGDPDKTKRFVTRYLRAHHADLFFADAAILVEGSAERILLPHFIRNIRNGFKFIDQCYITFLEISGSHAHRLEPLIRNLGLPTLVITDIDAGRQTDRVSVQPERSKQQITNNTTLRDWIPRIETIDELLDAKADSKELTHDQLFAVRVAYQSPISIDFQGVNIEILSNTFEDALVFENLEFFRELAGEGLVRKFREAIRLNEDATKLGQSMFESLKQGSKAAFALDVLYADSFESLRTPTYMAEGLRWLDSKLRRNQVPGHHYSSDSGVA